MNQSKSPILPSLLTNNLFEYFIHLIKLLLCDSACTMFIILYYIKNLYVCILKLQIRIQKFVFFLTDFITTLGLKVNYNIFFIAGSLFIQTKKACMVMLVKQAAAHVKIT